MASAKAVFLLCLASVWAQPSPAHPPADQVQRIFVPRENLSEVLQKVYPPDDPLHIRDRQDFEKLLQAYQSTRGKSERRLPVACRLTATFDPKNSQFVGEGTIETAHGEGETILAPWNLAIEPEAEGDTPMTWGIDDQGAVRLRESPFNFRWSLFGNVHNRHHHFDFRVPNCAVAYLDLVLPDAWTVRSSFRTVRLGDSEKSYRLFFGGSERLSVEILPREAMDQRKSVLTWKSFQVLRLDESATTVDAEVQLESFHEPTPRVSFLVDRAFAPSKVSVPIQRWTREETEDGPVRWTAEFRRPPLGPFDVVFTTTLPGTPGTYIHPLLVHVEGGLPRGETLDFSVDGSLKIVELDPGSFQSTYIGVDQDGRYHMMLRGPGGSRWDAAAMFLNATDVSNWPAFFKQLEMDGANEASLAAQLLRHLDEPTQRAVQVLGSSIQVDPRVLAETLRNINSLMTKADLFDLDAFATEPPADQAKLLLDKRSDGLSEVQTARANRLAIESIARPLFRSSAASFQPPTIRLATGTPDVDVSLQSFLRLQRDQVRLLTRIQWRCHRGTLYQPQIQVPADWEISSVQRLPSGQPIPYRLEPWKDGFNLLWLELENWLTARGELKVEIEAHPQHSLVPATEEPAMLTLPEVRPTGFPFASPSVYTLSIDADVPCSLENLPPAKLQTVDLPDAFVEEDGEQHSFEYESPLELESLQLLPRPPRFSANHRQQWIWDTSAWQVDWNIEIVMQQGAIDHFDLISNQPLDNRIQWAALRNNQLQLTQADPPRTEDGLYRYRVSLEVPIRKTTQLSARWTVNESSVQVPLVQIAGSDRFRGDIQVLSKTGQVVNVDAGNLLSSEPTDGRETRSGQLLLFNTSYIQLQPALHLNLSVSTPASVLVENKIGNAYLHCYSSLKDERVVEHIFAWLDVKTAEPLTLAVPGDCHLWNVLLDGETVQPWTADGSITLPGSLEPGIHSLEMVYAHAAEANWGMRTIELPLPFVGWNVVSLIHEVEHTGEAILLQRGDSAYASRMTFGAADSSQAYLAVGLEDSEFQTRIEALEDAFQQLPDPVRGDLAFMFIELGKALDVPLALDDPVISRAQAPASTSNVPVTLREWLQQRNLVLTGSRHCCVLTSRVLLDACSADDSVRGIQHWLSRLAEKLRQQGIDATGRFMTPVHFAARLEDRNLSGNRSLFDSRSCTGPIHLWSSVRHEATNLRRLRVTFVSQEFLYRCGFGLTAAMAGFTFLLGMKLSPGRLKIVLAVLLALLAAVALIGGPIASLLSIPGWTGVMVILGWILYRGYRTDQHQTRHSDSNMSVDISAALSAVLIVFCIPTSVPAAAPSTPGAANHKVVVPIDRDRTDQVIVPESLIRLLQSPVNRGPARLLLHEATYEGSMGADRQIRWHAVLQGHVADDGPFPASVGLQFSNVGIDKVTINGQPAQRFRPAGGNAVELQIAQPGPQRIEIDFHTSLLGNVQEREVEFRIPPCSRNSVRLELPYRGVAQLRSEHPAKLQQQVDDDRVTLTGELGFADHIHLRWRDRSTQDRPPAKFVVTSAHVLDLQEETRDLMSLFRFQVIEGEVDRLTFAVAPGIVVRRVDAENVDSWEVTDDANGNTRQLVLRLLTPATQEINVRIQAMVRVDHRTNVSFPELAPIGAVSEEGVMGITTSGSHQVEEVKLRNAEPASAANFLASWEKLGAKPIQRIALTKRFRQRPLELTLRLLPRAANWNVTQILEVKPDPHSRVAAMQAAIELVRPLGSAGSIQFTLPKGFELQRVRGDNLYQWFTRGNLVVLLPRANFHAKETILIEGRWRNAQRARTDDSVQFRFAGFEWHNADSTNTLWNIDTPDDWTAEVSNLINVRQETESSAGATRLTSSQDRHSFALTVHPVIPEADVSSVIAVTVDDNKVTYEGRFQFDIVRGRRRRFQLMVPNQFDTIEWLSSTVSAPISVPRGNYRLWSLEPAVSNGQPVKIDWRVVRPLTSRGQIDVPRIRLEGFSIDDEQVAVLAPVDQTAPAVTGLVPIEFTGQSEEWPLKRLEGSTADSVRLFRAEQPDWKLLLDHQRAPAPPKIPLVRQAQADILVRTDGTLHAVSRWQIRFETGGFLTVELPEACQGNDVWLDGRPLKFPSIHQGIVRIPLQAKAGWQSVSLYWSCQHRAPARQLKLPRLLASDNFKTLVRLRLPTEIGIENENCLSRAEWLETQLAFLLESLEEAFLQQQRAEQDLFVQAVVLEQLDHWRWLWLLVGDLEHPNVPEPGSTPRGTVVDFSSLQKRFDELVQQYAVGPLVQESNRRPVKAFEPNQILQWADSANSAYLNALPDDVIQLRQLTGWWPKRLVEVDWIWLLTAMAGLIALMVPGWTELARIYWPGIAFPLSILWLRWSYTPILGAVLLVLSLATFAWTVRRWFSFSPYHDIQTNSTVLHPYE